jgi:hypothetical protein
MSAGREWTCDHGVLRGEGCIELACALDVVDNLSAVNERLAAELERLGKGIERVVAKHGADAPRIADALNALLRDRTSTTDAVATLDTIGSDDPEGAHCEADNLLLSLVHPDIAAAYERLVQRCRWWACA